MLMLSMQNTLDLAAQVSGAEKASLLLLDEQGVVTDSILTRDHLNSETRTNLIGCVLDKGLAGWVKKHWKVGPGGGLPDGWQVVRYAGSALLGSFRLGSADCEARVAFRDTDAHAFRTLSV